MPMARPSRFSLRGFTMLELLVVITILVVAMLVFATFLGSALVGPSLERHAASIKAMVAGIRQSAATRKVHGELVFDYKNDQVVALSRNRLVSFAFETDNATGSGNVLGRESGGAFIQFRRDMLLRDGACLELPQTGSAYEVPWNDQFDTSGDYEGIAFRFDFCPMLALNPQGVPTPAVGGIATMGSVFTVAVEDASDTALLLSVNSGGVEAVAPTWLTYGRWVTVEVAVSRYGLSLWVDGRLTEAATPDSFTVPPALGQSLRLGGVPCRLDNVELFTLVSSQVLSLQGAQLLAPGVDADLELGGQAEEIYKKRGPPAPGPATGPAAAPAAPVAGLPLDPPPAIVHIFFDTAGRLDPQRHPGAVEIYLVADDDGTARRMLLTFHPLGAVTSELVDRFRLEPRPAGTPNTPGETP